MLCPSRLTSSPPDPVVVVALEAANVPMKRLPAVVYGGNQAAARWPAWRLYRVVQAGGIGRSRVQTATRPFSVLRWLQTCWCSGSGAVASSPPRLVNRKIRAASPHRQTLVTPVDATPVDARCSSTAGAGERW